MEYQKSILGVPEKDVIELIRPSADPDAKTKLGLFLLGFLLTPITLTGSLMWYIRAFKKFMEPENESPRLYRLKPVMYLAMGIGAIIIWLFIFFMAKIMYWTITFFVGDDFSRNPYTFIILFLSNVVFTFLGMAFFTRWRNIKMKVTSEMKRHGTARLARTSELEPYSRQKGLRVAEGVYYNKQGNAISVGGPRSGKGVNQLLPNILMSWLIKGSLIFFDPKGELCAISKRVLEKAGRRVVCLNAWDLLGLGSTSYNCLDILKHDKVNLSDDVTLIAEIIVPSSSDSKDKHFDEKARAYLTGLILHLVTSAKKEDQHLGTIWKWLRLDEESWTGLLADMMVNDDTNAGEIVKATANEIVTLMKGSEKEYSSIISTAQKATDFIKSPALQENLQSSDKFHPKDLANGDIALFLIVPADRLNSHRAYLQLVITTLLRSSIRNPGKDVYYFIDECFSLGYSSELELAMGLYPGYNIHIWTFWQSLVQLKKLYPDTWENFLASSSVRSFYNISDNFSAEYLSKMFGTTSVLEYDDKGNVRGASARPLITPDELRRESNNIMYTMIDSLPVAALPKLPYYEMRLEHDPNPYYKPPVND